MRAALDALSSRAAAVGPSEDSDIDDLPAAEDEDEDDASSRRVVDIDITVEAPAQPASRVVRMCPSLWPDAREATVYFPYPQTVSYTHLTLPTILLV